MQKLVWHSYPNADVDITEVLALDHFFDALSETEIRLRLTEVGPKTLSEGETIAVSMEAHRIADKQHTGFVDKVVQGISNSQSGQKTLENQMTELSRNLQNLQKKVQNVSIQKSRSPDETPHRSNFQINSRQNQSFQNKGNVARHNMRPSSFRGDNPPPYHTNNQLPNMHENQNNQQENFRQSNQAPRFYFFHAQLT